MKSYLKEYIVEQNPQQYTQENQAVWRYIMRQLVSFLSTHAHSDYLKGLPQTGIFVDTIPSVENIDKRLRSFGWKAVPVSGFIPPAAFMEFQAHNILPIATDMRTIDHILYTPAPDIVHEAAGHAPLLVNKEYSDYLREYAKVSSLAIIDKKDLCLYEAIRFLSDAKENPQSTKENIKEAEENLKSIISKMTSPSEITLLGRMNWWTAEYGLIGDQKDFKLFGAGLLSSIDESKKCLHESVKKRTLDLSCIDFSYDITEPQPQLFITPSFIHLTKVLREFEKKLSFKKGGLIGLKQALQSQLVNTIELDSGIQISGVLEKYYDKNSEPIFIKCAGPTQICFDRKELCGHSKNYHSHGYSTPIGKIQGGKSLHLLGENELSSMKIKEGKTGELYFESGIKISGKVESILYKNKKAILIKFTNCTVTRDKEILFSPEWGNFDLSLGTEIRSVFRGTADPESCEADSNFKPVYVPEKKYSPEQKEADKIYLEVRNLRSDISLNKIKSLFEIYKKDFHNKWLIGLELLEICRQNQIAYEISKELEGILKDSPNEEAHDSECIKMGIKIASQRI